MSDEVLLKVNRKNKDAQLLVSYLMTLPYVEMLDADDMTEVGLPFFSPESVDDLKKHVENIEQNISNGAALIDNEVVRTKTNEILKRYENRMVG